ncbi:hypothetical protein QLR68_08930 [Micromonospora sp. DH15]|nr:hypothetical protein [Micromonospora sp. DH15]
MTLNLILDLQRHLTRNPDPDGMEARSALLGAQQILMSGANVLSSGSDRWTFASLSVAECLDRLVGDLSDEATLTVDVSDFTADVAEEMREPIRSLLRELADLYADAASDDTTPPWRRLAWSSAAQHLDRALRELP